jgi:hypothetical protein
MLTAGRNGPSATQAMDRDKTGRTSRLTSRRPSTGVNNAVMTHILVQPHSPFPSSHTTDRRRPGTASGRNQNRPSRQERQEYMDNAMDMLMISSASPGAPRLRGGRLSAVKLKLSVLTSQIPVCRRLPSLPPPAPACAGGRLCFGNFWHNFDSCVTYRHREASIIKARSPAAVAAIGITTAAACCPAGKRHGPPVLFVLFVTTKPKGGSR